MLLVTLWVRFSKEHGAELWEKPALRLGVCWTAELLRNFGTLMQELHFLGCHGSCALLRLEPALPGPVLYPWVWWSISGWGHTVLACHLRCVALTGTQVVAPLGKFLPVQLGDVRLPCAPSDFCSGLYVYFKEGKYICTLFTLHQYWGKPQRWSCHRTNAKSSQNDSSCASLFT